MVPSAEKLSAILYQVIRSGIRQREAFVPADKLIPVCWVRWEWQVCFREKVDILSKRRRAQENLGDGLGTPHGGAAERN